MSTVGEIWEVMAEEISSHPHDRLEMFRGRDSTFDATVTCGSTGADEVLTKTKIDPDDALIQDAATELAAACARYDVTPDEIHNGRVRYTAVVAARVSIATRLSKAGWTGVAIGKFLFHKRTNLSHMLRGGRGKGVLPASRIAKDLVTRRFPLRPPPRTKHNSGNRGYRRVDQAVWALRRLQAAGEEHYIQRVVAKHFPELTVQQVYEAAFGSNPAPLTLAEAYAAEARGEGTVKFVGGVPRWIPNEKPRELSEPRAA